MAGGDAEAAMQALNKLADFLDEFTRSTLDAHTELTPGPARPESKNEP